MNQIKNKEILLTINLKGALGAIPNNADKKSQIRRSVKGLPYRSKPFREIMTQKCCRKTKLSAQSVNYFISDSAVCRPYSMKQWKGMSAKQRLEANLNLFDEGYGINWVVVE